MLLCAFRPAPLILVAAPLHLFDSVYCNPMRMFSHAQKDGAP